MGTFGFNASQLGASGSPSPAVNLASGDGPNGLALDSQGNLWVSTIGGAADIS
jgi:sugar lactone lactonase YvrE